MTTVEVLRAARAIYAINPSHAPMGEFPSEGTHCVITAIDVAYEGIRGESGHIAKRALRSAAGVSSLAEWNEYATTEEVLAKFDEAIAAAEAA